MKLLFDQNISFRVAKKLPEVFPNCLHVSDCGLANTNDYSIWKFARENDLIIVTFDSDFFDLSLVKGHPPKIIWIRLGNLSSSEIIKLMTKNVLIIELFANDSSLKNVSCLEIDNQNISE